jgi:hypothetical protein
MTKNKELLEAAKDLVGYVDLDCYDLSFPYDAGDSDFPCPVVDLEQSEELKEKVKRLKKAISEVEDE